MGLFSELNELMFKYRFRPSKKFAQIFIIDEDAINKMVSEAELTRHDTVLEIGAGTGFLTRKLLEKGCRVIAVELDNILFELLENELPKENLQLIHGNFLALKDLQFNKVVALPPYTISSGIVYKLLEYEPELAVLVFQREFAEKLSALPGFEEYCALSVLTQSRFAISIKKTIPAMAFFPKPGSSSAVIKMVATHKYKIADWEKFKSLIKELFRFQNKNLGNSLRLSYPFLKDKLKLKKGEFEKNAAGLHLADVKVNLISAKEFVEIFNSLMESARE